MLVKEHKIAAIWKSDRESQVSCESRENDIAYANEPLADEEWLKKYEEEDDETNKLEQELRERLEGSVQVDSWWVSANLWYGRVKK